MSYFGSTLGEVLKKLDRTQSTLAADCGIPASQINRYVRGVSKSIPAESAAKVIAALPVTHHPRLLVAYLRDCIPDGYAALVEIYAAAGGLKESPPSELLLPTIDKELDGILRLYADLAMRHEEVKTMLRSFLVAMQLWPATARAKA